MQNAAYQQDRELSSLPREQFSVPNFASMMAREELEDAACYYPAAPGRAQNSSAVRLEGKKHLFTMDRPVVTTCVFGNLKQDDFAARKHILSLRK
jgi:hypothetical protein